MGATATGAGAAEVDAIGAGATGADVAEVDSTGTGVGVGCRDNGACVRAAALGAGGGANGCRGDAAAPTTGVDGFDAAERDGVGVERGATGAAATGGGGNVGTTMPGGGAATAKGSSINSTGRSGSCSWKGEVAGTPGVAAVAAVAGVVAARSALVVACGGAGIRSAGAVAGGAGVCGAGAVGAASYSGNAESGDELLTGGSFAGTTFLGGGVAVAAALLVGMPTGFDTPAKVAPARRLAAALAAAAIFRAVAAAAGLIGAGAGVPGAAEPVDLAAGGIGAGALVSPRPNVPAPFVPSMRAGPPASEAPNNISGSSSSPAIDAVNNVGISEVSGPASGTGAATAGASVGLADRSSKSPCESKSSPESSEGLFAELDEAVDPIMGSSTGRSARGSSLGREAASIIFEPASGDQSSTYPAMPSLRYLGDGSQIGTTRTGNVTRITLFNPFPSS